MDPSDMDMHPSAEAAAADKAVKEADRETEAAPPPTMTMAAGAGAEGGGADEETNVDEAGTEEAGGAQAAAEEEEEEEEDGDVEANEDSRFIDFSMATAWEHLVADLEKAIKLWTRQKGACVACVLYVCCVCVYCCMCVVCVCIAVCSVLSPLCAVAFLRLISDLFVLS
jgi:hypothetical protein